MSLIQTATVMQSMGYLKARTVETVTNLLETSGSIEHTADTDVYLVLRMWQAIAIAHQVEFRSLLAFLLSVEGLTQEKAAEEFRPFYLNRLQSGSRTELERLYSSPSPRLKEKLASMLKSTLSDPNCTFKPILSPRNPKILAQK